MHTGHISKTYGSATVLNDVSFSLNRGEVLGVFGPNGSGKSTLLDIIALAARPDSGTIECDGTDARKNAGKVRPVIGYVPQEIALFEELTVKENLLCWSRLPGKKAMQKALSVAEELNLTKIYRQKVSTLSGGMKRRVNLAAALLGESRLLVLDEPFSGVDAENIDGMLGILSDMADRGVTQMISGHSPDMLMPLIDRVMVLSNGHVAFLGEKEDFMKRANGGSAADALRNVLGGVAP